MTTLTLRARTNPGDTTSPVALTMEQVDDNFIALKSGVTSVEQQVTTINTQITNITQIVESSDAIAMSIALG